MSSLPSYKSLPNLSQLFSTHQHPVEQMVGSNYSCFFALLLLTSYLYTQSTASTASSCVIGDRYSSCYDASNFRKAQATPTAMNLYYDAFMDMVKLLDSDGNAPYHSQNSCPYSMTKNLTLTLPGETRKVTILIMRVMTHRSTGNHIGWFYEVLSFALARGLLIGRLDPDTDRHLGTRRLEAHLPRLFIPNNLSYDTQLTQKDCDSIVQWPWENPVAYTWNATDTMNEVSNQMLEGYAKSNIPEKVFGSKVVNSVGVHFRCGDNLDHIVYGLIDFREYGKIFEDLRGRLDKDVNRVIIYTDASRRGENGQVCWSVLGELSNAISRWLPGLSVEVHSAAFAHVFSMIHFSKVAVCSVSTFCFFSTFGTPLVYQPLSALLKGYPTVNDTGFDPRRKIFRPVLLRPRDFPQLNESAFVAMLVNS